MSDATHTLEPPVSHLLDQLATAIVCLDSSLNVSFLNQSAESLFSISARKAVGEHCRGLHGVPESLISRLAESLETGQPFSDRQVTLDDGNDGSIQVDCLISPVRGLVEGRGLLMEVQAVDRQLRIAREEALFAQQEHSRSLLRGLAHEIKNPLGGLRGAAQLLERELPNEDLRDYTSIIIKEADRLQQLLDRMLGPGSLPQLSELNIHEPLEHVRKILIADAGNNVSVISDYDPSIPDFKSDWNRLIQVFLNIGVNALAAVGKAGNIRFKTRIVNNQTIGLHRHRLVIAAQIIDDGPGISDDMIDQIFYPMVTGRSGGTGLGLSIAQQTINQLGGLIECNSKPQNTVFTVYIPLEAA